MVPYVSRASVRLYYEDAGSGPVVLLHTGGGGDGRMWELAGYTTALAGYRTLVMDHRGHGRSDRPAGRSAHRMSEYVADVIAVLDDADAGRALIICGENEEPDAASHARLAAQTLPQGSAAVLPGLYHLQAFWRTDRSCPPLTAFLREHWMPQPPQV